MKFKIASILMLILASSAFAGDDVVNTQVKNTTEQSTGIQNTQVGTARDWNLTDADWAKYQALMKGPAGHYYPHLTPPNVLGIYAKDQDEMRKYAEINVREEHDKIEREERYDRAYHEAAERLYENEPIIKPFDYSPFTPIPKNKSESALRFGDHLVFFLDIKANTESSEVKQLVQLAKSNQDIVVDIYCLNAANSDVIQNWAKANQIPTDLVSANRITLNNENGKFKKTVKDGTLPYLMLVRDGESKPVDVGSL